MGMKLGGFKSTLMNYGRGRNSIGASAPDSNGWKEGTETPSFCMPPPFIEEVETGCIGLKTIGGMGGREGRNL